MHKAVDPDRSGDLRAVALGRLEEVAHDVITAIGTAAVPRIAAHVGVRNRVSDYVEQSKQNELDAESVAATTIHGRGYLLAKQVIEHPWRKIRRVAAPMVWYGRKVGATL